MLPGAGTGLRVFIRLTITSANSAVARHSVEQIAWAAYQQIAAATTAHFIRQTVAVTNTDIAPILTRPPICTLAVELSYDSRRHMYYQLADQREDGLSNHLPNQPRDGSPQ